MLALNYCLSLILMLLSCARSKLRSLRTLINALAASLVPVTNAFIMVRPSGSLFPYARGEGGEGGFPVTNAFIIAR